VPRNPLLPLADHVPPSPLAPIGNPIGGASFSIWQPGQINYLFPANATGQQDFKVPGVPVFQNNFVAWSPDGRYLLDAAQSSVLITPSGVQGPSFETLQKFQLDSALGLPVRDAAMQAVMEAMAHPSAQRGGNTGSTGTIAWSPDGKLMAMVATTSAPQGDQDYATTTISILSCATGKTLATLKAHAAVNQTGIGGNEYLAWSPDGKRLFYFTDQLGSLTTWGPGLLPQG
jgi:sugar lactone lactonase YvrE